MAGRDTLTKRPIASSLLARDTPFQVDFIETEHMPLAKLTPTPAKGGRALRQRAIFLTTIAGEDPLTGEPQQYIPRESDKDLRQDLIPMETPPEIEAVIVLGPRTVVFRGFSRWQALPRQS